MNNVCNLLVFKILSFDKLLHQSAHFRFLSVLDSEFK